ncbi:TIGR04255 family protein [Serratia sp. 22264]|uniref:TIGR04255 family protein n=1 Tax=Serratia sp. 22264 TaxID=3453897 RepID=UPI003F83B47B
MKDQLPKRLGKEPLVNVVFELRFLTTLPLSNILPGMLYSKLGCNGLFKTPHAEIPEIIRNDDPNLAFVPLVYTNWDNYQIHIGDRVIVLSCNIPYMGWGEFKKYILKLVSELNDNNFDALVSGVSRFSLKYIDIIEAERGGDFSELINIDINMGGHELNLSSTQVRTEKNQDGILVIMQMAGQAQAILPDGKEKNGLLIDIDCINNKGNISFSEFQKLFESDLEILHSTNKKIFFDFLTTKGITEMEPHYD